MKLRVLPEGCKEQEMDLEEFFKYYCSQPLLFENHGELESLRYQVDHLQEVCAKLMVYIVMSGTTGIGDIATACGFYGDIEVIG